MSKLYTVLQAEAAECGLACLAIIANYYGSHEDLRELRRRFPVSILGANLSRLISIANRLGFHTRPVRLEISDLEHINLPCILHWDLSHFVVLTSAKKGRYELIDPAYGERRLKLEELSKHFTGVVLELAPGAEFKQIKEPEKLSLRRLTGGLKGLLPAALKILALSAALQVFLLVGPFFLQWTIDKVLMSGDRSLLTVLGLSFGLLLILQVSIGFLRSWFLIRTSTTVSYQWTANVFRHLMHLPLQFFEKRNLGDIRSRLGAMQSIQQTMTTGFLAAIVDGAMAIITLIMMLIYSWKLALVTISAALLYGICRSVMFQPMRSKMEEQLIASARQESHTLESIRGVQSIKIAGKESSRHSGFLNLMSKRMSKDLSIANLGNGFASTNELIFGVERIAVIWIGASLALSNVFTVGMLVAYLSYKEQFASRVGGLIDNWIEFRMLRLHADRLADIVLEESEDVGDGAPSEMPPGVSLAIRNLKFRYAEGEPWVLDDCSFDVHEGEALAIVGPSGCGKTTLVKVILGLLSPEHGSVLCNQIPVHSIGLDHYRSLIGVVMQDDQLFAGTIEENISFFDDAYDPGKVEAAARMAAIHDDIIAMPMGYRSLIGDMGTALSGGQKQRIILARALYKLPRLLVLDEATSHLDIYNEKRVSDAIRAMKITRVIIAHRPETIATADRVIAMRSGKIVQHDPKTEFNLVAEDLSLSSSSEIQ